MRQINSVAGKHLVTGEFVKKVMLVIMKSTVYRRCNRRCLFAYLLKNVSGLSSNNDFLQGYSPERINPVTEVNTLTKNNENHFGFVLLEMSVVNNLYGSIINWGHAFTQARIKKSPEAAKINLKTLNAI